ncbi:MAG: CoA pyrophosphatase, partial [Alphaproteobacteria bacterium]|nr:CoA pyrophosphatase [Alphaproteobacteria bacterium]
AEIVERIAAASAWRDSRQAATPKGDHDLNPGMGPAGTLTPAAVLVPLVLRPGGLTVLLTQRTDHLYDHAGQISFPGGRIEDGDATPEAAALREAAEEVGLDPSRVELIGRLDTYVVRTGFEVTPAVGFVHPPFEVNPDPFEVAEVFEVPLAFILDRANHERHSKEYKGMQRFFYVIQYEDRYIWGATAAMLVNLVDILEAP